MNNKQQTKVLHIRFKVSSDQNMHQLISGQECMVHLCTFYFAEVQLKNISVCITLCREDDQ